MGTLLLETRTGLLRRKQRASRKVPLLHVEQTRPQKRKFAMGTIMANARERRAPMDDVTSAAFARKRVTRQPTVARTIRLPRDKARRTMEARRTEAIEATGNGRDCPQLPMVGDFLVLLRRSLGVLP